MSICIEYTWFLLKEVYGITKEQVSEKIEQRCRELVRGKAEGIKKQLDQYNEKTSNGENRAYDYLQKLKWEKNYFNLIRHLDDIEEFIKQNRDLTNQEKSEIEKLESYINNSVKIIGFSISTNTGNDEGHFSRKSG